MNQNRYPIKTITERSIGGAIGFFSLSVFCVYFVFRMDVDFFTFLLWIVIIGSFIGGVILIMPTKKEVYVINCPHCKKEIYYPVISESCDCGICGKKLVKGDDGIIKEV